MQVPLLDLRAQYAPLKAAIESAIGALCDTQQFVLGPHVAELESQIMSTVNSLGVGPMGFGGQVTLIGCKIGALNRLPASFFVSVAYDCLCYVGWASSF